MYIVFTTIIVVLLFVIYRKEREKEKLHHDKVVLANALRDFQDEYNVLYEKLATIKTCLGDSDVVGAPD